LVRVLASDARSRWFKSNHPDSPQWSIGVVAAHLVLNQTARVRLPHGLRTRPRGGPLGEVVLSTSGTHTPRTGSARGRFAAVAASTWTCGAMGAQLVYTESVGGSNPSGFTADACGNPYSARAVRPAREMRVAPLLGPGRPVVVVGDPRITSPWRSGERTCSEPGGRRFESCRGHARRV